MKCESCGHTLREYRHSLNKGLVQALQKLATKGEAKLSDLNLTVNQHNNFQKLQYWGLIEKKFLDGIRVGEFGGLLFRGGRFLMEYRQFKKLQ